MSTSPAPPWLANPTPFSRRLLTLNKRLVVNPSNGSLAVRDQMLISVSASPVPVPPFHVSHLGEAVGNYLKRKKVTARLLTTVFAKLPNPLKLEDVAILKLVPPPGETIFSLVADLRKQVLSGQPAKASPNHVLIPAANELWCPFGPPAPVSTVQPSSPKGTEEVQVTVIDSGYIWAPPSSGTPWGPNGSVNDNPLHGLTTSYQVHEADWLSLNSTQTTATWQNGTPNEVDANSDGKLDALAGHANFVAGVIAQHCELPNIHIWNHNSGFSPKTPFDNLSTEAAICRSLVMSQQDTPTQVIQIGHASPFLGNLASAAWGLAFARIAYRRHLSQDLVVTCPAGNQGLLPPPLPTIPRFPAALHSTFPFVKGVGSYHQGTPTPWSNRGPWVACSADGENVTSSFLYVHMPVEDDPTGSSRDFTPNSWATWNGTSFAAPKVAGELAAQLSPSVNAAQGWTNLMCTNCTSVPDYGIVFQF